MCICVYVHYLIYACLRVWLSVSLHVCVNVYMCVCVSGRLLVSPSGHVYVCLSVTGRITGALRALFCKQFYYVTQCLGFSNILICLCAACFNYVIVCLCTCLIEFESYCQCECVYFCLSVCLFGRLFVFPSGRMDDCLSQVHFVPCCLNRVQHEAS